MQDLKIIIINIEGLIIKDFVRHFYYLTTTDFTKGWNFTSTIGTSPTATCTVTDITVIALMSYSGTSPSNLSCY